MPLSPKKCWGKNVIFTPKNIVKNCVLSHEGLSDIPVNRGNQWINPPMIANTAPIDKT